MPAALLALMLAMGPADVVVLGSPGPAEGATQREALRKLFADQLGRGREALVVLGAEEAPSACDATCLAARATSLGARCAARLEAVPFAQATVFTASAGCAGGGPAREVAARAEAVAGQPEAVSDAAVRLGDALGLRRIGEPAPPPPGTFVPTAGFNLKVGNTLPSFSGAHLELSSLNLRFDFEADYYATDSFVPFLDASLVLARDSANQSLQLVPVLVGAKYVFRPGQLARPYLGVGLGLGFLSGSLVEQSSQTTSFAVYGVAGVALFPWERVGFNAEASLNLSGVEVSAESGVLFAFSLNGGVVVLF